MTLPVAMRDDKGGKAAMFTNCARLPAQKIESGQSRARGTVP
jgi:hypothetical protein